MYMNVYLHVYLCTVYMPGTYRGQKAESDH